MDVEGLADEWANDPDVRARAATGRLLQHLSSQTWCIPCRGNAKMNRCVLVPLLTRLCTTPTFHLFHLEPVQQELQKLFTGMNVKVNSKVIYQTSVELKKLCGFIKRRVNHKEVTKAWVETVGTFLWVTS